MPGIRKLSVRHSAPPGGGGWDLRGLVVRNLKSNQERVFVPEGEGPGGMSMGENSTLELTYKAGQHIVMPVSPAVLAMEKAEVSTNRP